MPKNITQYDLLISCPGDITNEINIIENSVSQFNSQFSDALGISIRTKYWRKNSYPQSGGKPQALLNEQFVNDCDAAVLAAFHQTEHKSFSAIALFEYLFPEHLKTEN